MQGVGKIGSANEWVRQFLLKVLTYTKFRRLAILSNSLLYFFFIFNCYTPVTHMAMN